MVKRRSRRNTFLPLPSDPGHGSRNTKDGYYDLPVPVELDVHDKYVGTVTLINDIRRLTQRTRLKVRLVFQGAQRISPSAALCLVAEVYRARHLFPERALTGTYPDARPVSESLKEMGFFRLLGVNDPKYLSLSSFLSPARFIKFQTSNLTEGEHVQRLADKLEAEAVKIAGPMQKELFRSLTEAMTNVSQHAYLPSIGTPKHRVLKNQWWLLGQVNKERNRLTVLFYDQGWGIPKTLRHTKKGKGILELVGKLGLNIGSHGDLIRHAIEHGESRTEKEHRGKGLTDLLRFIDAWGEGSLEIFSGSGRYTYDAAHGGIL